MVEDHFAHSIVPPRPPSKRPFQVLVAVAIIIAVAALVVYYWPLFSKFMHSVQEQLPSVINREETVSPGPLNEEEKDTLYEQVVAESGDATSTALSHEEKQLLFESVAPTPVQDIPTGSETAPESVVEQEQTSMTPEEKQRLLESIQ